MVMTPARNRAETEFPTLLRIPLPIDIVQVQTADTTIFTALNDADFQIETLYAADVSGSGDTVSLYLVPSGGSTGAATALLVDYPIAANDREVIFGRDFMMMMQPGDTLVATCGTNDAVNIYGFGYSYQGQYTA